jgi:hypothetical protein
VGSGSLEWTYRQGEDEIVLVGEEDDEVRGRGDSGDMVAGDPRGGDAGVMIGASGRGGGAGRISKWGG